MKSSHREDVELIGRAERFWRPIHAQVDWKGRFYWDGEHFGEDMRDREDIDRRDLRWVGQETFNAGRHEEGAVTSAPSSVMARPVDEYGDPASAERAVALVEGETENPAKCFDDVKEAWVSAASVLGYGAFSIEFHEHVGPWGELAYVNEDSRDLMWDPRAKNIHHPNCRWVCIRRRVPLADCEGRRGWNAKVVKALKADQGYDVSAFGRARETFVNARLGEGGGGQEEWDPGDEVTLYYLWYRAGKQAKRRKRDSYRRLSPGERYMHCAACGWQSATEDEVGVEDFPEAGECDQCGGMSERADAEEQEESIHGYPDIRLKIIAPYQGVEDYVYDGPPPWPTRSFPIPFLPRFIHPFKPNPPSLVDLNAYNQGVTDMLMTLAAERMAASAPVWSVPDDGVKDAWGERFEFSDEQGHVLFRSADHGTNSVQLLEGTGIPANWSSVYQAAIGSLVSHQGIADIGMAPTQSRDIAASSLAQQIQQQEIPVAHFQRRYQRATGMAYGLIFDAIKGTYPPERIARLRGDDGRDTVAMVEAADMPNFDFILADAPDFNALSEAKQKGLAMLMQVAREQPEFLEVFAQLNNIPPSVVQKMQEAAQAQRARLAATMPAGPAPADAGAGAAPAMGGGPEPADMVEALLSDMGQPQYQQ